MSNSETEEFRKLISADAFASQESVSLLFEQYKLYVESAEQVSQRRATANSFYISVNTILLTTATLLQDKFGYLVLLVLVSGVAVSLFWLFSIHSYRQLNSGKYLIIQEIEQRLPLNLYAYEWGILKQGKLFRKYWQLSYVEMVVPLVFVGLYLTLSIILNLWR